MENKNKIIKLKCDNLFFTKKYNRFKYFAIRLNHLDIPKKIIKIVEIKIFVKFPRFSNDSHLMGSFARVGDCAQCLCTLILQLALQGIAFSTGSANCRWGLLDGGTFCCL